MTYNTSINISCRPAADYPDRVCKPVTTNYPISTVFVQEKETTNPSTITDLSELPATGRILALDPGTKRVGVAVSDETRTLATPLDKFPRTSWKKLLLAVENIVAEFDAVALVIGLPLESDGSESEMSLESRRWARNFGLSLNIPVFLQDERVSSYEAKARLWEQGVDLQKTRDLVDSEAAAIILSDFLSLIDSSKKAIHSDQ
jgi:putative holliday junction resolvase